MLDDLSDEVWVIAPKVEVPNARVAIRGFEINTWLVDLDPGKCQSR